MILSGMRRVAILLGLAVLVVVVAGVVASVLRVHHHRVVIAPTATPRVTSGFPVTSAVIKNVAGMNAEPAMRPAVYRGPNPDGWWCQPPNCTHPNPTAMIRREMTLMAGLHVGFLRLEFAWPLLEPQKGHYDWSRTDSIVLLADKLGLQLQPVLDYTPAWAAPSPYVAPTHVSAWTSFLTAVVGRYKNSIHYWELWDEPDSGNYWLDGDKNYVTRILVPGYRAVKAADSSAKVLLGAPYYADGTFLSDVYSDGGGKSFDIAGVHEYINVLSPNGVQSDVDTVHHVLSAHGQPSKPVWIGEYGYRETSPTLSDSGHIAAMRTVLLSADSYAEAAWYTIRDDMAMSCCPPRIVKKAYWGLVTWDDTTLKNGYYEMRKIVAHLGSRG